MTRHESRETAFIIVFEKMFNSDMSLDDMIALGEQSEVFSADDFAKDLAQKVLDNVDEIDELINENLVRWSPERIAKITRAILRIAACELKYTDIPVAVAANEAVEPAKKYSTNKEASFINGVLASISGKVRE